MKNEEIHDSRRDEKLSQHLLSLKEKIDANNAQNEAMKNSSCSSGLKLPSLCWVPTLLRGDGAAYRPNTVSIGPLHCEKYNVKEMEAVKISYMCSLFDRTGASEATKRDCMAAVLEREGLVKQCYAQVKLKEDLKLAEMMLIDGCFIVEFLYRNYIKYDDPILRSPFKYYAIQHDLLLLENQIPFFVLAELFSKTVEVVVSKEGTDKPTLPECVLSFFQDMMGLHKGKQENLYDQNPLHILHLLHIYYIPRTDHKSIYEYKELPAHNYCATRLDIAGVKFQASEGRDLFDIKFSTVLRCSCLFRGGRIEIPPFSVYESTEPFLRNLIAFEQCCPFVDSFFTSHAFLMDILIDSAKDVELLEEAGVIENFLGSREAVCRVFNDICKNAVPRHFLYGQLLEGVINFRTPWQVYLGTLIHTYFGNVWVRISVIAAIILFLLTLLQTIYTMRS